MRDSVFCWVGQYSSPILAVMLRQAGLRIGISMIMGGLAIQILGLLLPGNPARVGYRFARFPKELSPHEQELTSQVERLRKPWLMVIINIPYFLALLAYALVSSQPSIITDLGSQIIAASFFDGIRGRHCLGDPVRTSAVVLAPQEPDG